MSFRNGAQVNSSAAAGVTSSALNSSALCNDEYSWLGVGRRVCN